MKSSVLAVVAVVSVLSGGFLLASELRATSPSATLEEQRVNANLIRVRVGDRWEEFRLMPLADHLCQSGDEHYQPYCN